MINEGLHLSCTYRFEDEGICHYYLVGMCPYEEFERTKHDVGPCPLIHDDDLRDQFQVRSCSVTARTQLQQGYVLNRATHVDVPAHNACISLL